MKLCFLIPACAAVLSGCMAAPTPRNNVAVRQVPFTPDSGTIAIHCGLLIDGVQGLPLMDALVVIRDGRIKTVKADASGKDAAAAMVQSDPRSSIAEAYRSVRTALQFSTSEGAPKQLVITSTTRDEGKSTTAVALSIKFAQMGQRVLLIDADMRNPSVHKQLEMPNESAKETKNGPGSFSGAQVSWYW